MGWMCYNHKVANVKAAIEDNVLPWPNHKSPYAYEILKSSMVGSTYYAAIQRTERATGQTECYALIVLTTNNYRDGFCYKQMDESCGPFEDKCPLAILNLLTPTDSECANEWRARVRTYHAARKAAPKLAVGDVVVFSTPLTFTGYGERSRFVVVEAGRRTRFRMEENHVVCRIRPNTLQHSLETGNATV